MHTVSIVFHSTFGHTRAQAEAVARGIADVGAEPLLVPVGEALERTAELDRSAALVFGSPTYMGSVSAPFKAFMDATAVDVWRAQRWRNKWAAGFTSSAWPSGDKLQTLLALSVFAAQHGMIWVGVDVHARDGEEAENRLGSWVGAMARAAHGTSGPSLGDLRTAEHLGRRVATLAMALPSPPDVASASHRS